MDEEVRFGKDIDTSKKHDITNGASPEPKENKVYGLGEEYKQIFKLVCRHSPIYIGKFLFLLIIVTGLACFKGDSYSTLIISSFTLLGSLLFDQLCKKKIPEDFDFIRAEKFCIFMSFYIFFLFLLSLFLLCVKDDLFSETIVNVNTVLENASNVANTNEGFWTLGRFKWFIFCLCCSADFSALVEAIVNIPEESLPSRQKKLGIPKKVASENQNEE